MITGIDVSAYQPRIDWLKVARAGHRFAFVKATEGTYYRSPEFARQWAGAQEHGLLTGPYHFARWERDTPEREAEFFKRVVGELPPGTLPPVLDLEWLSGFKRDPGEVVRWALRFLARAVELFGRCPIIYTGPSFWRYRLLPAGEVARLLSRYPLWTVDYASRIEPKPMHQVDWQWDFWQWTGSGECPGITRQNGLSARCDLNVFRGSSDELRLFAQLDSGARQ